MIKRISLLILLLGLLYSCGTTKKEEVKEIEYISEQPEDTLQIDESLKIGFLMKALEIKNEDDRIKLLKEAGYVPGIYHSAEPLSDGTTHETIDEGYQTTEIVSKDYEFICFRDVKNYATNETNEWLIYKTKRYDFNSGIREEINDLQLERDKWGMFLYKNISISFAQDRYAYVDGNSYLIKSIILREEK